MNCLQKRINDKYPNENIEVIQYTIMKEPAQVKCLKCNTAYTLAKAENFVRNNKTCVCKKCANSHIGGKLTLKDFQNKINEKFPDEDLTVLNYTLRREPSSIKCNKCGNIVTLQNAEAFLNKDKKHVCHKCFKNKQEMMNKSINEFLEWTNNQNDFIFFPFPQEIHSKTLVLSKCKKCGLITKKTIYDYMRNRGCSNCKNNLLKTKEEYQQEIGNEYTVLEYNGMNHRSLFKHNLCNFIYKANTKNYSCPKCKGSNGKKAIRFILTKYNIDFEEQKRYLINGHELRVDFYLTKYDKVIEYQGEQHFKPIAFFGGEEAFKKQQLYDNYKKEYFKDKMIEIKYSDYDNIETILLEILKSSSTIM